jgi:hypothetical protein
MIRFECDKDEEITKFSCDGNLSEILTDSSMLIAHIALLMKTQGISATKAKRLVTIMLSEGFKCAEAFANEDEE